MEVMLFQGPVSREVPAVGVRAERPALSPLRADPGVRREVYRPGSSDRFASLPPSGTSTSLLGTLAVGVERRVLGGLSYSLIGHFTSKHRAPIAGAFGRSGRTTSLKVRIQCR